MEQPSSGLREAGKVRRIEDAAEVNRVLQANFPGARFKGWRSVIDCAKAPPITGSAVFTRWRGVTPSGGPNGSTQRRRGRTNARLRGGSRHAATWHCDRVDGKAWMVDPTARVRRRRCHIIAMEYGAQALSGGSWYDERISASEAAGGGHQLDAPSETVRCRSQERRGMIGWRELGISSLTSTRPAMHRRRAACACDGRKRLPAEARPGSRSSATANQSTRAEGHD